MKWKASAFLLLCVLAPAICSAQSVKAGTWTGTVLPPDRGDMVSLTFDVTVNGDSLGIVIHAGEHGDFPAAGGYYAADKITFTFVPGGPTVACTLARNEQGTFAGSCLGDDGSEAKMTMTPPQGS